MNMSNTTTIGGLALFFAALLSVGGLTLFWALATRRPMRARPHLVGRRAAAYYYSPTGLQDERGITPMRRD